MNLLDLMEDVPVTPVKVAYPFRPDQCGHPRVGWQPTTTFWADIDEERRTWTCGSCGVVRGRP